MILVVCVWSVAHRYPVHRLCGCNVVLPLPVLPGEAILAVQLSRERPECLDCVNVLRRLRGTFEDLLEVLDC